MDNPFSLEKFCRQWRYVTREPVPAKCADKLGTPAENSDIPGSTRKLQNLSGHVMVYPGCHSSYLCCRSCRHVEPHCFSFIPHSLPLLAASGTIHAQAQDPFTQNRLPDLGMMPESHEGEKHLPRYQSVWRSQHENNDLDTGEQARQFAFGQGTRCGQRG